MPFPEVNPLGTVGQLVLNWNVDVAVKSSTSLPDQLQRVPLPSSTMEAGDSSAAGKRGKNALVGYGRDVRKLFLSGLFFP